MIDLDPQSSLSEICIAKTKLQGYANSISLDSVDYSRDGTHFLNYAYKYFMDMANIGIPQFKIITQPLQLTKNLHFIPNSLYYSFNKKDYCIGLDDLSMLMGNSEKFLFVLPLLIKDNFLDEIYDYIIFDTPPSSNIITQSAFLLSDFLLIPTIMDQISIKGVEHYWNKIRYTYDWYCNNSGTTELFKSIFGNEIEFIGVFETMRRNNNSQVADALRSDIKNKRIMNLFDTLIKMKDDVVSDTMDIAASLIPDLK